MKTTETKMKMTLTAPSKPLALALSIDCPCGETGVTTRRDRGEGRGRPLSRQVYCAGCGRLLTWLNRKTGAWTICYPSPTAFTGEH